MADNIDFEELYVKGENEVLSTLKSIESSINSFVKEYSQSQAQDSRSSSSDDWKSVGTSRSKRSRTRGKSNSGIDTSNFSNSLSNALDGFADEFEKTLYDALGISELKSELSKSFTNLSKNLGITLQDVGEEFGKQLASKLIPKTVASVIRDFNLNAASRFKSAFVQSYASREGRSTQEIWDMLNRDGSSPSDREVNGAQIRNSKLGASYSPRSSDVSAQFDATIQLLAYIHDSVDTIASVVIGETSILSNENKNSLMSAIEARTGSKEDLLSKVFGKNESEESGLKDLAEGPLSNLAKGDFSNALKAGLDGLKAIGPQMAAIAAISVAVDYITEDLGKLLEAVGEFGRSLIASANRDRATRRKIAEEDQKKLEANIRDIVQAPYNILKDSMNRMIQVWEDGIRTINQTQGYSKAELQSLIGSYAERIRDEGLERVVSVSDFTSNLEKVLQSGLSGQVAEEFAYVATKLNAAIPTQDFFNYADAYASLASNAIKNGESQTAAIEYANKQLELFASDVLYASRQLAGGFSTGLKSASDLFEKSAQIALSAKIGDPSQIAGVLTSVSAITGAIAPDLASSLVDAVYKAAVGGNDSSIVALRSLAGVNAGNTEFLRQLASDPQKIFSTLFRNLASMQNMSQSNYMEVAQGLSSVFGMDMATFARVDFDYLATAISSMNVSNAALEQNMKQLASGQSTQTAEQMRIAQINQYMIEEGLAYVLDNEVARSIQEHMWEEELAVQIQEATYSVDLTGASMQVLQAIADLLDTIATIINPIYAIGKLYNLAKTAIEASANDDRIKAVLEAGKVGEGNAALVQEMTATGNAVLMIAKTRDDYIKLQTKQLEYSKQTAESTYRWSVVGKSVLSKLGHSKTGTSSASPITGIHESITTAVNLSRLQAAFDKMKSTISEYTGSAVKERMDAEISKEAQRLASVSVSKSQIESLARQYMQNPEKYGLVAASQMKDEDAFFKEAQIRAESDLRKAALRGAQSQARYNVQTRMESGEFGQSGYEAWAATAAKYGIADLSSALDELGYAEQDIRKYFQDLDAQASANQELERQEKEETFWESTGNLLDLLNINLHDVLDKGDLMSVIWPGIDEWLRDIDSDKTSTGSGFRGDVNIGFNLINTTILGLQASMESEFRGFRTDWTNYYIKHTTYNEHLGISGKDKDGNAYTKALKAIRKAEKDSSQDAINALTEALLANPIEDLMDPTVQQNVFLASILQGIQVLIQQNNTQGKLKLPDAISALATGMTVVDTNAANASTVKK